FAVGCNAWNRSTVRTTTARSGGAGRGRAFASSTRVQPYRASAVGAPSQEGSASSEGLKFYEVQSEGCDHTVPKQGCEGEEHASNQKAKAGSLSASKRPADEAHR